MGKQMRALAEEEECKDVSQALFPRALPFHEFMLRRHIAH
jgi:hypothetical protein